MTPIAVAVFVFACVFGGTLLGMWLRGALPGHHLSDESKDVVKLGMGLIATMTALVLGLVTASAKSAFDVQDTAIKHMASERSRARPFAGPLRAGDEGDPGTAAEHPRLPARYAPGPRTSRRR